MAQYAEQNLNEIQVAGGYYSQKPISTTSTLAVTGAATFGTAPTGPKTRAVTLNALVGATVVLTAADSGGVFINRSTSGTPSWTIPAATTAGLTYTFICANTTAGFTVTGAVIRAKTSATGTAITTTTTLTNTQATAVVGDTITIVSNGTDYNMVYQSGIFAAS